MNADDKRKLLLQEQAAFFRRGGVSLEKAREMGVGFLYDDGDGGGGSTSTCSLQEKEKEEKEAARQRPEDAIPDLPENQAAREFLKKAPTKGLFMPLGKEVKVMQCWRCKQVRTCVVGCLVVYAGDGQANGVGHRHDGSGFLLSRF